MNRIHEIWPQLWHWLTTSRYTRALEGELARLRAENRALVNSILGIAGIPPLPARDSADRAPGPANVRRGGSPFNSTHGKRTAPTDDPGKVGGNNHLRSGVASLPPVRRRSWQQIGRMLEIEEARQVARPGPAQK